MASIIYYFCQYLWKWKLQGAWGKKGGLTFVLLFFYWISFIHRYCLFFFSSLCLYTPFFFFFFISHLLLTISDISLSLYSPSYHFPFLSFSSEILILVESIRKLHIIPSHNQLTTPLDWHPILHFLHQTDTKHFSCIFIQKLADRNLIVATKSLPQLHMYVTPPPSLSLLNNVSIDFKMMGVFIPRRSFLLSPKHQTSNVWVHFLLILTAISAKVMCCSKYLLGLSSGRHIRPGLVELVTVVDADDWWYKNFQIGHK